MTRSRLHWELATPDNELLQWYRTLLEIRTEHILSAERTAAAELVDDIIRLWVPRVNPTLLVSVSLSNRRATVPLPGKCLLRSDEDGYAVSVNVLPCSLIETEPPALTASIENS